jgi:hypothetical protein
MGWIRVCCTLECIGNACVQSSRFPRSGIGEYAEHTFCPYGKMGCLCNSDNGHLDRVDLRENVQKGVGLLIQKACRKEFFSKGKQENGH